MSSWTWRSPVLLCVVCVSLGAVAALGCVLHVRQLYRERDRQYNAIARANGGTWPNDGGIVGFGITSDQVKVLRGLDRRTRITVNLLIGIVLTDTGVLIALTTLWLYTKYRG